VSRRREHSAVRIERRLAGFDRLGGGAAGHFGFLKGGHRLPIGGRDLADESGGRAMERRNSAEPGQTGRLEAVVRQDEAIRADLVFDPHQAVHQTHTLAGDVLQTLAVVPAGRVLLIGRQLLHVAEQLQFGLERGSIAGQRIGQLTPCHRRIPAAPSAAIVAQASRRGRISRSTSSMPATSFFAVDSISRPVM